MKIRLLLAVIGLWNMAISQTQTVTYTTNNNEFANPERGIYHYTEAQSSNYINLNQTQLTNWRVNDNITMVIRIFYLKDFINAPISQSFLDNMETDFNRLRNAGLKAVIKFAYTENTNGAYDANKARILEHINQLTPVIQNNSDVIAVMQAGFIGVWGEWYYTDHFGMPPNQTDLNNRRDIVEAILNMLPNDRMVQIRTPKLKRDMYTANAILDSEGFNESYKSRIGHHNDCFLASDTDYGTYTNIIVEYPYLEQETKYTPMGGETCNNNQPRSACETALEEMEMFHWSYLNSDYHPDVLNGFNSGGCFSEIKNRLGYRFQLNTATFPTQVSNQMNITLEVENTGFANLYNPRNAYLVLRNTTTNDEFKLALQSNPRNWSPNSTQNINESLTLPNTIYEGDYELFLHLPDGRTSLQDNPSYAIQLANDNVWESNTGYNNLNMTITVNRAVLSTSDFEVNEYKIYPNPAKEYLTIEIENISDYNIELYNTVGQKVSFTNLSMNQDSAHINTTSLSNGIYLLRVFNESKKLTKKVIINH